MGNFYLDGTVIILKLLLNSVSPCELDLSGSEMGFGVDSSKHDKKHSGAIKGSTFLDLLSSCYFLKKKLFREVTPAHNGLGS